MHFKCLDCDTKKCRVHRAEEAAKDAMLRYEMAYQDLLRAQVYLGKKHCKGGYYHRRYRTAKREYKRLFRKYCRLESKTLVRVEAKRALIKP